MKKIFLFAFIFLSISRLSAQNLVPPSTFFDELTRALRITPDGVYTEDALLFPGAIDASFSEVDIPQGEIGCIDVTMGNFNDIVEMNFSISWNNTLFEFVEITNINLEGLTQADFGINTSLITLQWDAPTAAGVSVPDDTVIFSLCYQANGNVNNTSVVAFVTIPINIYVTDVVSNGSHVGMNSTNGLLRIIEPLVPLGILDAQLTGVSCENPSGGSINLSIEGGTAPYSFEWSNNENTEDLTNLTSGMYTVTISDANTATTPIIATYNIEGDLTPPVSNAGNPVEITCINPTVVLDGSGSSIGTEYTYQWTSINGNILAGVTSLTPEVDTEETYTLLVTNTTNACTAESSTFVTTSTEEPNIVVQSPVQLTCLGDLTLDASASDSGDNFTYSWNTANGIITSGVDTETVEVSTMGVYELTLTNNENGCSSLGTVEVTEPVLPEVVLPTEVALDCQDQVRIDGSNSSLGSEFTYSWSTVDGVIASGEDSSSPFVSAVGTYELIVTNNTNACSDIGTTLVTADVVLPNIMLVSPATLNCFSDTLVLDASGSAEGMNVTYLWTTQDGNILSDETSLFPKVDTEGRYDLVITNTLTGCTSLGTVLVESDTTPPMVNAGMDTELDCSGMGLTLDGTASDMGADFTYLWTTTDGSIASGETTLNPVIDNIGTYQLMLTNTLNGCTAVDETRVSANTNAPTANAGNAMTLACGGAVIELDGTASDMGDNFSYLWTTENGNIIAGETTLTPAVNLLGTYQLIVTNTDNSCTGTATVEVNLDNSMPTPFAGEDLNNCGDSILIMATPVEGATGYWSSDFNSTVIRDNASNETYISHLVPGENYLYWTLSTEDCLDYASDTLLVYQEGLPNANDDLEVVELGAQTIILEVLNNDDLSAVSDYSITVVETPTSVDFMDLGDGEFEFIIAEGFEGSVQAMYELCNLACMNQCDTALASVVVEAIPNPLEPKEFDFPNAITPNGDGINDAFVVDELANNMDLYPNNDLVVFNRWGDIVYQAKPYNNDWEGTNQSGGNLPHGTYYFILRLDINTSTILKGDITILK